MKKKKGFEVREIAGEKVVVAYGLENIDFSKMISLNETAYFVWDQIEPGEVINIEKLVKAMMKEYEIDEKTALKDISDLIKRWEKEGLVEEEDNSEK